LNAQTLRRSCDPARRLAKFSESVQSCGGVPFGFGGESGEGCARFIWHAKSGLCSREPSGDARRESVNTREQRLHMRCRRIFLERRSMLSAAGVQHARCYV
jgi:hypothetical protein